MHEDRPPWSASALLVFLAAVIAAGMVCCCVVLARAFVRVRTSNEMIRVMGSARKPIRSDLVIWSGSVTRTAPTVDRAFRQLQVDMEKVTAYLIRNGIPKSEIVPMSISTKTLHEPPPKPAPGYNGYEDDGPSTYRKVVGYQLSQGIEVRSSQVDLVDRLSRQSTEMIGQGVPFESNNAMYIYTQMSQLKVTMQAEAAKDALARADQIARSSRCRVGKLRFARMNVPQITPLYSSSESDGGVDDTSSIDKEITAIVVAGYSIR